MKFLFASLLLTTSVFAQNFKSSELLEKLDKIDGKFGIGSITQSGKTVTNKECDFSIEELDIWNSEETRTGTYLLINVKGLTLATDLDSWYPKDVTFKKKGSVETYTNEYISAKKCNIKEVITLKGKSSYEFSQSIKCPDRRKKEINDTAKCNFKF